MIQLIKESTPKAKKEYYCNSSKFVKEDIEYNKGYNGYLPEEIEAIEKAKANNWRIQKGEVYLYQFLSDGGDSWSFKSIIAMDAICRRLKLYPED